MCGVAGAYQLNSTEANARSAMIVNMVLSRLQNRGDLSAGMARFNPEGFNKLEVRKGRGTVKEFFGEQGSYRNQQFMEEFTGLAAIGHTRYATSGQTNNEEAIRNFAQPYLREHNLKWKEFTFAFNGNINNTEEIKKKILHKGHDYYFKTNTDTELIKIYLSIELSKLKAKPTAMDFVRIFKDFAALFDGAYNIVYMDANGNMVALRDPLGMHPFFWARKDDTLVISSEDSAIRALSIDDAQEIPAGSLIWTDGTKVRELIYADSPKKAVCIFEYVYFMNAASTFEGRLVQKARGALGLNLANLETMDFTKNTVIAPVPGTAIGMCDGYQMGAFRKTGKFVPRYDALVKVNESRSFIADFGYHSRDQIIRKKFDLTPGYLAGKELIMVDDSIVRGSTSKKLIRYVREQTKAKKVHMRVAAAPSKYPCFYGINMPTLTEPIASNDKPIDQIRDEIGADSLAYNTVESMVKAVAGSTGKLKVGDFRTGCFTGIYPTKGGNKCLSELKKDKT